MRWLSRARRPRRCEQLQAIRTRQDIVGILGPSTSSSSSTNAAHLRITKCAPDLDAPPPDAGKGPVFVHANDWDVKRRLDDSDALAACYDKRRNRSVRAMKLKLAIDDAGAASVKPLGDEDTELGQCFVTALGRGKVFFGKGLAFEVTVTLAFGAPLPPDDERLPLPLPREVAETVSDALRRTINNTIYTVEPCFESERGERRAKIHVPPDGRVSKVEAIGMSAPDSASCLASALHGVEILGQPMPTDVVCTFAMR